MNKIKEIIIFIPVTLLVVVIGVIVLPFILIVIPFNWIRNKKFNKEYNEYLKTLEGKNFFCYNNRKKGFNYIKEELLPYLPAKVEPIFLNGKRIESKNYESKFLSKAFYDFKNYTKFPQLLKIREGKTFDCSINNELFRIINLSENKKIVFEKIRIFFELDEPLKK